MNSAKLTLLSLSTVFITACATTEPAPETVSQIVTNSDAADLRHVGVMGFGGWYGEDFSRRLDDMLRSARYQGENWFNVSHGDEDQLFTRWSGYGSQTLRATNFGQEFQLDGVWYGYVESQSTRSDPFKEERTSCVEWDGLFECRTYETYEVDCVDLSASVSVHAKLISVHSGEVVIDKELADETSQKACEGDKAFPPETNADGEPQFGRHASPRLERTLAVGLVSQLRRDVAPYEALAQVKLMQRPAVAHADLVTGFEAAISDAEAGMTVSACEKFEVLSERFDDDASLSFNLGACAELAGNLDVAKVHYSMAVALLDSDGVDPGQQDLDRTMKRLASLD